jgi:hypothetical protein
VQINFCFSTLLFKRNNTIRILNKFRKLLLVKCNLFRKFRVMVYLVSNLRFKLEIWLFEILEDLSHLYQVKFNLFSYVDNLTTNRGF